MLRTRAATTAAGLAAGVAIGALLAGCGSSTGTAGPSPTTPVAGQSDAPEPQVSTTVAADPSDPCTLLTSEQVNAVLGTNFAPAQPVSDPAREIVTCTYRSDDGTQIVDVGVSQTPGKDAFQTNQDLAPAYFGGDARPVEVAGADKAYLVIAETYDAPVIGMLVGGRFALVQVGVEGATPDQGEELAGQMATRMS